jgi:eukaryotic-like serine/threonine-protein kinase
MIPSNAAARRGPYELSRSIGQDALTHAFVARRVGAGNVARLELLQPELTRDERFRARFLDGAAAMLSLSHPVLPRVLEVVPDADVCGVALELLPGRSLAEILLHTGRSRCPVDLHVYWLRQVLAGLEHAHGAPASGRSGAGFVHGDVCPGRVHVGNRGEVQLLGGGFAACRHALSVERGRPVVDVRYAAPEVLLGEPPGPSSDLYALGVMLWEALTRQARANDTDLAGASRRRTLDGARDLESAWPDAPEALVRFFARALAIAPADRFASAAEMAEQLDGYLARASEPAAVLRARVPAWLATTFGVLEDGWGEDEPTTLHDRSVAPSRSGQPDRSSSLPPLELVRRRSLAPALPEAPASSPPEPPRPSDTGGHRAFSSTWNGQRPITPAWSAARAALPALAVAAGAVAAVWIVIAQRAPAELGAGAATAEPIASSPRMDRQVELAPPQAMARKHVGADAGVEPAHASPGAGLLPAFFAGRTPRAATRGDRSPPLAPDELPQVDDARDSLQAAIVRSARAQRRALRLRRARPSASTAALPASSTQLEPGTPGRATPDRR